MRCVLLPEGSGVKTGLGRVDLGENLRSPPVAHQMHRRQPVEA